MNDTVRCHGDEGIVTLTLNRPDHLNVMTPGRGSCRL